MKKVLYVLLPQFAEHELPYLTQPLRSDAMAMKENRHHPQQLCRLGAHWRNSLRPPALYGSRKTDKGAAIGVVKRPSLVMVSDASVWEGAENKA